MLRITLINMLGRVMWLLNAEEHQDPGECMRGWVLRWLLRVVEATSTTSVWWQYCWRRALFMCRYIILFVLLAEAILKDKQEMIL